MKKSVRTVRLTNDKLLETFPDSTYKKASDIRMAVYITEAQMRCEPGSGYTDPYSPNQNIVRLSKLLGSENVYNVSSNHGCCIHSDVVLDDDEMSEERYIHHTNNIENIILRGTSGYVIGNRIMEYIDANFVERSDA